MTTEPTYADRQCAKQVLLAYPDLSEASRIVAEHTAPLFDQIKRMVRYAAAMERNYRKLRQACEAFVVADPDDTLRCAIRITEPCGECQYPPPLHAPACDKAGKNNITSLE